MDTAYVIDLLEKDIHGSYPHSQIYKDNPAYIQMVLDYLLMTQHLNSVSVAANTFAITNPQETVKRLNDRRVISILGDLLSSIWQKLVDFQ